jgi:hypothetical protein
MKSYQFSPEALGLGSVEPDPSYCDDCPAEKLTLRQLLKILQTAAKKDPHILDLPVFTTEFGSLEAVSEIIIQPEQQRIVIDIVPC